MNGEQNVKNVPEGAPPSKGGARLTTTIDLPAEITVTAAPPDLLSQRNVLAMTGIPPKAFLQVIRAPGCTLEVIRLGKLRLVERAPFLAWLRSHSGATRELGPANDAPAADTANPSPEDVDDVLRELGCQREPRRAGGRR